jgi:lysozyme-like protein
MSTKGTAVAMMGAGGLFVYAGVKGYSILTAIHNIVQGKPPNTGQSASLISAPTPTYGGTTSDNSSPNGPSSSSAVGSAVIAAAWIAEGGPANTAHFASQVAIAESGGNASVTSANPDGGINVGWFQLDTRGVGAGYTVAQLQDSATNTRITIDATNGGRNWSDWADPVTDALPNHQYTP